MLTSCWESGYSAVKENRPLLSESGEDRLRDCGRNYFDVRGREKIIKWPAHLSVVRRRRRRAPARELVLELDPYDCEPLCPAHASFPTLVAVCWAERRVPCAVLVQHVDG